MNQSYNFSAPTTLGTTVCSQLSHNFSTTFSPHLSLTEPQQSRQKKHTMRWSLIALLLCALHAPVHSAVASCRTAQRKEHISITEDVVQCWHVGCGVYSTLYVDVIAFDGTGAVTVTSPRGSDPSFEITEEAQTDLPAVSCAEYANVVLVYRPDAQNMSLNGVTLQLLTTQNPDHESTLTASLTVWGCLGLLFVVGILSGTAAACRRARRRRAASTISMASINVEDGKGEEEEEEEGEEEDIVVDEDVERLPLIQSS